MKTAFNPYLPSYEYIPDGEPYVFGDRVYVFGSHDLFNGWVFCLGDYVCWSAPVNDLGDWRYEGIIYEKTQDMLNKDGKAVLYAPDVTVGPDRRYYLYYCLDKYSIVSVAVCDTPAGKYQFYGHVKYEDGTRLGERDGDPYQFDPGVLTEGNKVYLYTGFCAQEDMDKKGSMCVTLGPDMLTISEESVIVVPSSAYSAGTEFEGHAFFEASSIRKISSTYYFIYSSEVMHELCYATSKNPREGFRYGGVIVSNCDQHIDSYKPADMIVSVIANNHGSIVEIKAQWYIFYHRQTNGTWYSRQGCAEKITIKEDGSIPQVEMTSCGLNDGPLIAKGEYFGYIACNLFLENMSGYEMHRIPRVTQDGRDGDETYGYIANLTDGCIAGFKYFKFEQVSKITLKVRAYAQGTFEVRKEWDGPAYATIPVHNTNNWEEYTAIINIPDGVHAIYLVYKGSGNPSLLSFTLE